MEICINKARVVKEVLISLKKSELILFNKPRSYEATIFGTIKLRAPKTVQSCVKKTFIEKKLITQMCTSVNDMSEQISSQNNVYS